MMPKCKNHQCSDVQCFDLSTDALICVEMDDLEAVPADGTTTSVPTITLCTLPVFKAKETSGE